MAENRLEGTEILNAEVACSQKNVPPVHFGFKALPSSTYDGVRLQINDHFSIRTVLPSVLSNILLNFVAYIRKQRLTLQQA